MSFYDGVWAAYFCTDAPVDVRDILKTVAARWLIELFFWMFKRVLSCRHLLRTKQNGVEIQILIAIIACLLFLMHTGRAPTKLNREMICLFMSGWASLENLERRIGKRKAAQKNGSREFLRVGPFAAAARYGKRLPPEVAKILQATRRLPPNPTQCNLTRYGRN